jgi:hypothetical protein
MGRPGALKPEACTVMAERCRLVALDVPRFALVAAVA